MKKFVSLLLILVLALSLGVSAFALNSKEQAENYLAQAADMDNLGYTKTAAELYSLAADEFLSAHMYPEARAAYEKARDRYAAIDDTDNANYMQDYIDDIDKDHPELASTISQGNLAIVTAVAGVAVGLAGGYFLFGRKKKTGEA